MNICQCFSKDLSLIAVINLNQLLYLGRALLAYGTAYSMSKYTCEAFSDGLRYEMRPWGLSVHIIEPGMFPTCITDTSILVEQWNELWDRLSDGKRLDYGIEYLEMSKF